MIKKNHSQYPMKYKVKCKVKIINGDGNKKWMNIEYFDHVKG